MSSTPSRCCGASSCGACRSSALPARRSPWPRMRSRAVRRRRMRGPRRSCTRSRPRGTTLCDRFADMVADYLRAQVDAGVASDPGVRLVGRPALARRLPRVRDAAHEAHLRRRCADLDVPSIHFGVGTTAILPDLAEAGGHVIGVDWRLPLDEAWAAIGFDRGDPGQSRSDAAARPVDRLLATATTCCGARTGRPGHIFNLGHGVLPMTPLEHVQELARTCTATRRRGIPRRPWPLLGIDRWTLTCPLS